MRGLWNGIQSLAGWLWDMVSGWASSIWNGILGIFGIHSPSTKMFWVGEMLIEGLANSINVGGGKAVRAMENMGGDILGAVDFRDIPVDFSPTPVKFPASPARTQGEWGIGAARMGNTTVIINSPKAVDAIEAARQWKKTTQQLAMGF